MQPRVCIRVRCGLLDHRSGITQAAVRDFASSHARSKYPSYLIVTAERFLPTLDIDQSMWGRQVENSGFGSRPTSELGSSGDYPPSISNDSLDGDEDANSYWRGNEAFSYDALLETEEDDNVSPRNLTSWKDVDCTYSRSSTTPSMDKLSRPFSSKLSPLSVE
jgi:hypothetical protein